MPHISINLSSVARELPMRTKRVGDFHDYIIGKGKSTLSVKGLFTENVNTCTAGELIGTNTETGKGTNFMFHLAPELQSLQSLEDGLKKQIDILRETCDDIQGFICGGLKLYLNNKEAVQSFDLYTRLGDLLDKFGVKFSMLCGKTKGAPMENIYGVNKSIYLQSDAFKGLDKKNKMLTQDEVFDILENNYDIVEKADNHIFQLNG